MTYSVEANPWLWCALAFPILFYIPGMAWGWVFTNRWAGELTRADRCLSTSALSLLTGFMVAILSAILLAECGAFFPWVHWLLLFLLTVLGSLHGLSTARHRFMAHVRQSLPGLLFLAVGAGGLMLLPHRGEWILGGWDPGIYVSQGVYVARTATFHPGPDEAYGLLTPAEVPAFTENLGNYRSSFTAVPIDPETRTHEHLFFRVMPSFTALLTRCGGLRAATRANLFAGLMLALLFSAALRRNGARASHVIFSSLLLFSQPILLYMLQFPSAEIVQLLLFCGIVFLLPMRRESAAAAGLLALTFFAALLNRVSSLPFFCLLLVVLAWQDLVRPERRRVQLEHLLWIGALVAGVGFDLLFCGVTFRVLHTITWIIFFLSSMVLLGVVFLDVAAWSGRVRQWVARIPGWCYGLMALLAFGVVFGILLLPPLHQMPKILVWLANRIPGLVNVAVAGLALQPSVRSIVPFFGAQHIGGVHLFSLSLWLAAIGGILLFARREKETAGLKAAAFLFWGKAAVMTVYKHIWNVYPYAARRYLVCGVPAVALCAGYALSRLWETKGRKALYLRIVAVALLAAVLALTAKKSWHAWNRTEYDGISVALAEVARHIDDKDLVVVDHHWWGTPLRFIYGKRCLNGRMFFEGKSPEKTMALGMQALTRLRAEGYRIRFLTSTKSGLKRFPLDVGAATLDWESGPVAVPELIHGPRVRDFVTRERKAGFRLYTWGEPGSPNAVAEPSR